MFRHWSECSKTFPKPKKKKKKLNVRPKLTPGGSLADTLGLGLLMCDVQFKIENKRN